MTYTVILFSQMMCNLPKIILEDAGFENCRGRNFAVLRIPFHNRLKTYYVDKLILFKVEVNNGENLQ